jgi:hypothetical protein
MAMLVGRNADRRGRKPLSECLIVPVRGACLHAAGRSLSARRDSDGIGAGLFGALSPPIVADLTWGTGRFNVTCGALQAGQATDASLSTTIAGLIVVAAVYSAAFLVLAAIAAASGAILAGDARNPRH